MGSILFLVMLSFQDLGGPQPVEPRVELAELPAQTLACLDGVSEELRPGEVVGNLYRKLREADMPSSGLPFFARLESVREEGAEELPTAVEWTVCAPVPAGPAASSEIGVVVNPASPVAFTVCSNQELELCLNTFLSWLQERGHGLAELPRFARRAAPVDKAAPDELATLFTDLVAIGLEPIIPIVAPAQLEEARVLSRAPRPDSPPPLRELYGTAPTIGAPPSGTESPPLSAGDQEAVVILVRLVAPEDVAEP